jgi:hypothetical protein
MLKRLSFVVFCLLLAQTCWAGTFLVNYYIKDIAAVDLRVYLAGKKLSGFLVTQAKAEGVIFCEKKSEAQDTAYGRDLALTISKDLKCRVVYNLIHDSDVYLMVYINSGRQILEYDSWPGYFEGEDPVPSYGPLAGLAADFKVSAALIKKIFDAEDILFADERLDDFAKAIGAPSLLSACSFSFRPELVKILKHANAEIIDLP